MVPDVLEACHARANAGVFEASAAERADSFDRRFPRVLMELGPVAPLDRREPNTAPAVRGDSIEDDFERLTLPCLGDVARFARSLTRDRASADDLVQETYLQALRGWHTFQSGADPRRWLFAICHHAFLRTTRRDARYVDAPENDPELESFAAAVAHSEAQRSGVVDALDRMDLGPAIDRALDTLPPHFRGVVVLVDVEGQSYEEAAAVLGVAVGTVRSRLFRGRRLLQDLLFEHARDAGLRTSAPTSSIVSNQ
jgi:RNA polymerase sigma-70 factor (ECF subfamily)